MVTSTSSAEPEKLFRYADVSAWADQELASASGRLRGILQSFEGSCTEYPVSVSHLAGSVQSHAQTAENVARWVYQVGEGFLAADSLSWLGRSVSGIYLVEAVPAPRSSPGLTGFSLRWPSLTLPPWLAALLRPFMRSRAPAPPTPARIPDMPGDRNLPYHPTRTFLFLPEEKPLVDENGKAITAPDKDGKPAKITISSGMPVELLGRKVDIGGKAYVEVRITQNGKTYVGFAPEGSVMTYRLLTRAPVKAEQVPTAEGETKQFTYWRYDYSETVPSNCTWFAAAGVAANSDGRVVPEGWGAAGNWYTKAKESWDKDKEDEVPSRDRLLAGPPDKRPAAGDVMHKGGHVAFVEETWLSDDGTKIVVVLSEENAGYENEKGVYVNQGGPVSDYGVEPIEFPDATAVKRYRRYKVFDVKEGSADDPAITESGTHFIHPNYDKRTPI